jgi:hypothetical protein
MCTARFYDSAVLRSAHSVFMCFVWISEQTAIISLYSINWLVFITETDCVYCAVRTGSWNKTVYFSVLKSLASAVHKLVFARYFLHRYFLHVSIGLDHLQDYFYLTRRYYYRLVNVISIQNCKLKSLKNVKLATLQSLVPDAGQQGRWVRSCDQTLVFRVPVLITSEHLLSVSFSCTVISHPQRNCSYCTTPLIPKVTSVAW